MRLWEGSPPPTRISCLFATYLGHFGAPFLMLAHSGVFGTHPRMFGTFEKALVSLGAVTTAWNSVWNKFAAAV